MDFLSAEERENLQRSFKNPEFAHLFQEYCEEISDKTKLKDYEQAIQELEKKCEVEKGKVVSKPCVCLKTTDAQNRKVFVNLATSSEVSDLNLGKLNDFGHVPYVVLDKQSINDNHDNECPVYSVAFGNQAASHLSEKDPIQEVLVSIAFEGIEKRFHVQLSRSIKVMKNCKQKGVLPSTVVCKIPAASDPSPLTQLQCSPTPVQPSNKITPPPSLPTHSRSSRPNEKGVDAPSFTITHQGTLDMQDFTNERERREKKRPKNLLVKISLPKVARASEVDVDIDNQVVLLNAPKVRYSLKIPLPLPVNEEEGSAQFDLSTHLLTLTLPVCPEEPPEHFSPPSPPTPPSPSPPPTPPSISVSTSAQRDETFLPPQPTVSEASVDAQHSPETELQDPPRVEFHPSTPFTHTPGELQQALQPDPTLPEVNEIIANTAAQCGSSVPLPPFTPLPSTSSVPPVSPVKQRVVVTSSRQLTLSMCAQESIAIPPTTGQHLPDPDGPSSTPKVEMSQFWSQSADYLAFFNEKGEYMPPRPKLESEKEKKVFGEPIRFKNKVMWELD